MRRERSTRGCVAVWRAAADRPGDDAQLPDHLRALAEGPMRLAELRRATGLPAQTTLRGHLVEPRRDGDRRQAAGERDAVRGRERADPGGARACCGSPRASRPGSGGAPDGPLSLRDRLRQGRDQGLRRRLGLERPRHPGAAADVADRARQRASPTLSYPALERRLSSMRMAGLVEAAPGAGRRHALHGRPRGRGRGSSRSPPPADCEQVQMRRAGGAADPRSTSRPASCSRCRWSGCRAEPPAAAT